jgi:Protein of unknown function (DUF4239)
MNLYWVYDYPTWVLFIALIALMMGISILGVFTLRRWTDRLLNISENDNSVISEYLSVTGVFFGLVLGMVAVGAWDAYGDASQTADDEASIMATLYRSVALLPDADAGPLKSAVRDYASVVIKQEWPAQQSGIAPAQGDAVISRIGKLIYALPADTPRQQMMLTTAVNRYYALVEARRHRVSAVASAQLPGSLWWVVIMSTFIILSLSLLMHIGNRRLDIIVNMLMAILTGSILAFIIAMDNPFRGEISVSSEPYKLIQERLMEAQI